MALVYTPEQQRLKNMPTFKLESANGGVFGSEELQAGKASVVIFICNHCPYVKKLQDSFAQTLSRLQAKGVEVCCINSNDAQAYPEDSFDKMKLFAKEHQFTFPYLYDETQAVAKSFGAVCTPDFFGFNAEGELVFRGCFEELEDAMIQVVERGNAPEKQTPSMGCSIKWKEESFM